MHKNIQTNVKGTFLAIKTFLPTANHSGGREPAVLVLTTGMLALPPVAGPGMSSYSASKMAQLRMIEYLAAEEPGVFVAAVHPGMYDTPLLVRMRQPLKQVPLDDS